MNHRASSCRLAVLPLTGWRHFGVLCSSLHERLLASTASRRRRGRSGHVSPELRPLSPGLGAELSTGETRQDYYTVGNNCAGAGLLQLQPWSKLSLLAAHCMHANMQCIFSYCLTVFLVSSAGCCVRVITVKLSLSTRLICRLTLTTAGLACP